MSWIRTQTQIWEHKIKIQKFTNPETQTQTQQQIFLVNQTQKQQTQTQQLIFLVNQTQKQQTQTQTSVRIQTQTQKSIFKKPAIHLQKTQVQTQTQIQTWPLLLNPLPLLESESKLEPAAMATKSLSAPWVTISAVDFHMEEPISSMAWPTNSSDSWGTEALTSSEVGKSMTARDATSRINDVSFFNSDPNSLYRVGRSRSLTPISTRSFWSIRQNSKSQWSPSPNLGLDFGPSSVWERCRFGVGPGLRRRRIWRNPL